MLDFHYNSLPHSIIYLFLRISNFHINHLLIDFMTLQCWVLYAYNAKKGLKSRMRYLIILKICQRNPLKRKWKSSSQYSRDWRFLYGAWSENAEIQTAKLNQYYCTSMCWVLLKNLGSFFFTMNICHFPFFSSFLVYLFGFLYISSLLKISWTLFECKNKCIVDISKENRIVNAELSDSHWPVLHRGSVNSCIQTLSNKLFESFCCG